MLLPAADEYIALLDRRELLAGELAEAEGLAADLDELRQQAAERRTALAALESRTVSPGALQTFRGRVMETARATGCQVRRVSVGDARVRPWRRGDHPLTTQNKPEAKPTGYALRTQPVSLAVSGKLASVRDFLARMESLDLLVHVHQFVLHPTEADGRDVSLDLDLLLFHLETERTADGRTGAGV